MENPRVIIDTDILIDLLRNKKEATALISELEKKGFILSTTAVNAYELYYGAQKSTRKEKSIQAIKNLLRRVPVSPLTLRSARKAGRIFAELETKGQSIGLADAFIAAIALSRGYRLVTRNSNHFAKIDGLNVITTQKA